MMAAPEEWLVFFYRMFPSGFYFKDLIAGGTFPEQFWTDPLILRVQPDQLNAVIAELVDRGVAPALACTLFHGDFQRIEGSLGDIVLRSHEVNGEVYLTLAEQE